VLVDGYERLRERVLAGRPDGWRLGHGLLVGKGLAAWIAARTALAPAPRVRASADRPANVALLSARTGSGRFGVDQLVAVLAEMALAHT
jgi:hypothetical protein